MAAAAGGGGRMGVGRGETKMLLLLAQEVDFGCGEAELSVGDGRGEVAGH